MSRIPFRASNSLPYYYRTKVPFVALIFLLFDYPSITCHVGYLDFDKSCSGNTTNLEYREMADTLLRFQVNSGGWEKNKPVESGWDEEDFRDAYGMFDPEQSRCVVDEDRCLSLPYWLR